MPLSGELVYVVAILLYALSINIDRVIKHEIAEDNYTKQKAVNDTSVPMYTVPTVQTQRPPDYKDVAEDVSQEASTFRKSEVTLTGSQDRQMMTKSENAHRRGSTTGSQIGCPTSEVEETVDEHSPLHRGRGKTVGALLWEKMPFFVIVAVVVLLAIIIRAFAPLYLSS